VTLSHRLQYLLILFFAVISFFAYGIIPNQTSVLDQAERIFLLSAGLGGIIATVVSLAARISFVARASEDILAYDLRLFGAVASSGLAAASIYASKATGKPLFLFPVPALAVAAALCVLNLYPIRGRVSIRPLTEDRLVRIITGRDRLKRLAEYRAKRFATLLAEAGVIGNPYTTTAKSLAYTLILAAVALPAAFLLGYFIWFPLIIVGVLPVFPYVLPEMRLKDRAGERRDGVERELPFFSILVNVLGSAGVSLYSIMTDLVDTRMFDYIRKEALLVRRDVTIFGMDPTESFERLASYHPSRKLGSFLLGYTSKVRSGGDIPTYLSGESGILLRELEEGWARYSQRSGIVGSMMITLFGIIPMLLLIVGIFSPTTSVLDLTIFTGLGVPFLAVLLVFMAGRMQPVGEEPLAGNPRRSLVLSLAGLAVGYLSGQLWIGLASSLFIFCTVYGYSVVEQRREMREIDDALPGFMKDLMEFKRQEYDLTRAILNIGAHNRYTPSFDRVISRVAVQLRSGTPLNEVTVDPRSRLARVVFFVLGQMAVSGGGTVETYYQLSTYTTKVIEMKRATMAEMRPYVYLSFVSPVMLAFGVTFVSGVVGSFGGLVGQGLASVHAGPSVGAVAPQLKEVSSFLIVASSAALGLISAKMIDFTVRNTLRVSANVVVATLAAFVLNQVNVASLLHLTL
jgi:flagellar protein FlaJ